MLKALSALLLSLVVCAVSGAFLLKNKSWNVMAAESARQSRITLQHAEQNIGLLKKAERELTLTSLSRDQDSLKVDLALRMSELSANNAALNLAFEQRLVSAFRVPDSHYEISILSLKVSFLAMHAPSVLQTLARIGNVVGIWPYEFRACEIFRSPHSALAVNCVLHIYHWPASRSVGRS